MNILIDIRSLLEKPYTGVAQYTLNFLNEILEKDKENKYFLFYNSAKTKNDDFSNLNYPNVEIIDTHYPNKIFNFLLWLFKWPKIDKLVEKRIGQKIDKTILPNFNFVAFSKELPFTLVVHDLSFEIYPKFFTLKQRLWHKLVNPKKLCQKAKKIITHSKNTKNDLINLYKIPVEKIEVKKPPLSKKLRKLEKDDPELERVRKKYNLPPKFILYLGQLEPRKNLDTLIKAFQKLVISYSLSPISLIIAGEGRERKKLEKLADELKIVDYLKFLGYLPEKDKVALYNLASVFVYPSFYEGFGYPVAEAMACGKPVIVSHTSSLTEIESNKITFINPYDINDLVGALNESIIDQS